MYYDSIRGLSQLLPLEGQPVCGSVPHDALRFQGVNHSPRRYSGGVLADLPRNRDGIHL